MSQIVAVFKDIAQLNPLFRDQITIFLSTKLPPTFLTNQTNSPILQRTGEVQRLQDVLESLAIAS
jgi:ATP-dependent Lon protease